MNEIPGENTQREQQGEELEEQSTENSNEIVASSETSTPPAEEPATATEAEPEQESDTVPLKRDAPETASAAQADVHDVNTADSDTEPQDTVPADSTPVQTAAPGELDATEPTASDHPEAEGADTEGAETRRDEAIDEAPATPDVETPDGDFNSPHEETATEEELHGEGQEHAEGEDHGEGEPHRPKIVLKAGTDPESIRALELCKEKVSQLHLKMHPLAARWDGDKHVTIFFRADEKVDFRKLVRELSRVLRARIELRQLGPREQGKLCGLVGKCGQPLCCQTFLGEFTQSSIKMAKTQDLALNPMKISGVCGRLLCCLNYEQEMYAEVKGRMPKVNKWVDTEFGPGKVVALNVLKETVTVQLETSTRELSLDEVRLSEAPPQN